MARGDIHKRLIQKASLVVAALVMLLAAVSVLADLQTPVWYDANGVGAAPDWHYRIPIDIPANAVADHTVRVDVDFNQMLTQLGAGGTFDPNSPRVVRSNGVLSTIQQFTDTVYAGATDSAGNGRGEVRFLLEDNGAVVYYLYFDILENGAKAAWDVDDTINGNFEFSTDGDEDPPNWSGIRYSRYDAFAIANEFGRTVTDTSDFPTLSVNTDEIARSGQYCYLLGGRTVNEARNRNPSSLLTRQFDVPASNPGVLRFRYRVKGWGSADNGNSARDSLRAVLMVPGPDPAVLGPDAGNYTTHPFSPNLQGPAYNSPASTTQSGYGQYNGWDTNTNGTHLAGMTIPPGSEPWFEVVVDLGPYAGQSIQLRFLTRNSTLCKSWFHIDDVEWSVVDGVLGTPQIFGVNIIDPNDTAVAPATIYYDSDTLSVIARVDAQAAAVTAEVFDPGSASVAGTISLFNNGTHGDAVAGDAEWTNDGSIPADSTYLFLSTDMPGTNWQVVVNAMDGGGISSDTQVFTLITPPNIMLIKTALTESDPVNGTSNAKAIPGADILYEITARNQGGTGVDTDSVFITDPISANTVLLLGDPAVGPVAFIDGATASGLTFNFGARNDPADDVEFSIDGGLTYSYSPPLTGATDPSVTHIRINPKGSFNGSNNGSVPAFTLRFRARIQ